MLIENDEKLSNWRKTENKKLDINITSTKFAQNDPNVNPPSIKFGNTYVYILIEVIFLYYTTRNSVVNSLEDILCENRLRIVKEIRH